MVCGTGASWNVAGEGRERTKNFNPRRTLSSMQEKIKDLLCACAKKSKRRYVHCVIHGEARASKALPENLHSVVSMGVRRNFSRGGNVDILLILFNLLRIQCKWTGTEFARKLWGHQPLLFALR